LIGFADFRPNNDGVRGTYGNNANQTESLFLANGSTSNFTPKALHPLAQGWREAATLGYVFRTGIQLCKSCGIKQPKNAATPLGLNVEMTAPTPGSRWCGNPGLVGVTPLAYLLGALHFVRHFLLTRSTTLTERPDYNPPNHPSHSW